MGKGSARRDAACGGTEAGKRARLAARRRHAATGLGKPLHARATHAGPIIVAHQVKGSSPTGPALQLDGGSLPAQRAQRGGGGGGRAFAAARRNRERGASAGARARARARELAQKGGGAAAATAPPLKAHALRSASSLLMRLSACGSE